MDRTTAVCLIYSVITLFAAILSCLAPLLALWTMLLCWMLLLRRQVPVVTGGSKTCSMGQASNATVLQLAMAVGTAEENESRTSNR